MQQASLLRQKIYKKERVAEDRAAWRRFVDTFLFVNIVYRTMLMKYRECNFGALELRWLSATDLQCSVGACPIKAPYWRLFNKRVFNKKNSRACTDQRLGPSARTLSSVHWTHTSIQVLLFKIAKP